MIEDQRAKAPDIETTLRATLGRAESPGVSSTFDDLLSQTLAADRGTSRRSWKRRRCLQRLSLLGYTLISLVVSGVVLIRLPTPQDPRVMVLSLATLIFVVGSSAALGVVFFLVRRGVIDPHG